MTQKQKWWHGLKSGFIGGAATSIDSGLALLIISPKEFDLGDKLGKTLLTILVLGVLAGIKVAVAYLKRSPVPELEDDDNYPKPPTVIPPSMKIIALITGLLLATYIKLHAAEPAAPPEPALYAAGTFMVAPFASARVVDSHAEFGGGLAATYTLTPRLALEGDVVTEGIDDSNWQDAITEAGGALKYYFPIKETGFAPYLIGGYQRDLIAHENRVAAGAGLEYRQGRACLFADARLNHGFEQELSELGNRVDVRVGVGWSF